MTILLDELEPEESSQAEAINSVECSWCGEAIETDGKLLTVAMCTSCYAKMLADFQKAQRQLLPSPHASDR